MESLISRTDLPSEFGLTLLLLALILTMSPWLSGSDFGLFKVPSFREEIKRRLRVIGPIALLAITAAHIPFPGLADRTISPSTDEVIVYSGTKGGVFYPVGEYLAAKMNSLAAETDRALSVTSRSSRGSIENCEFLSEGPNQPSSSVIALGNFSAVVLMSRHTCVFDIRSIAPVYPTVAHLIVRRAAYASFANVASSNDEPQFCRVLREARGLYLGPPSSGTGLVARNLIEQCPPGDGEWIESALTSAQSHEHLTFGQALQELQKTGSPRFDAGILGLPAKGKSVQELNWDRVCLVSIQRSGYQNILNSEINRSIFLPYEPSQGETTEFYDDRLCDADTGSSFSAPSAYVFLATHADAPDDIVALALRALFDPTNRARLTELAPEVISEPCEAITLIERLERSIPPHKGTRQALDELCSSRAQ